MEMFSLVMIYVYAIIFIATLIRSAFGFGDALIAMPLLAVFISVQTATPLIAFTGLIISVFVIIQDYKYSYINGLWKLILSCIAGVPLGLIFLKNAGESTIKVVLGLLIIIFGLINLIYQKELRLNVSKFFWLFGLLSGILGGAYNTNGPPVIIYGKLSGWDKRNFRAVLQAVFLPTNLFIITAQGLTGFWTKEVMLLTLYSLPFILAGTLVGMKIAKSISSGKFNLLVNILMIFSGLILLFKVIF